MDIIEGSYYVCSRQCMKLFGLWPFQPAKHAIPLRIVTVLMVLTILIPSLVQTYESRSDFYYFLLCIPSLLYFFHYIVKMSYMALTEAKMRSLLDRVARDFLIYKDDNRALLHEYTGGARTFNGLYTMYMFQAIFIFNATGFIPHMLDFVAPLNESRPRHEIRYVKYNIAFMDNSFYLKLIHGCVVDILAIVIVIGFDTLFISLSQHACALFKIVVLELRKSSRSKSIQNKSTIERDGDHFGRQIIKAVLTHKHALEFLDDLEATYGIVNLMMFGIVIIIVTVTEFETILHKDVFDIMLRFLFYTVALLLLALSLTFPGQMIKNHSAQVHESCYDCEWYRGDISKTSRKLLIIMMMRSEKPSFLTAGKIFVLDLQTYVKFIKASMSYFAFLSSVHQ